MVNQCYVTHNKYVGSLSSKYLQPFVPFKSEIVSLFWSNINGKSKIERFKIQIQILNMTNTGVSV